jgi:heme/copper-type cytochrome/quinol oxidase subunit 2
MFSRKNVLTSNKNNLGSLNGLYLRIFRSRILVTKTFAGFSLGSLGIFNNPATAAMEGIVDFHHFLYFFLFMIIVLISWFLYRIIKTYTLTDPLSVGGVHRRFLRNQPIENPMLEIIWTVLPALILVLISIPSFTLLYSTADLVNPLITVKVIGHQWYWVYEYSDPVLYTIADE